MVCSAGGVCGTQQLADGTACVGSYTVGDCVEWTCTAGQCAPTAKKTRNDMPEF
jgi:hypothetical protein